MYDELDEGYRIYAIVGGKKLGYLDYWGYPLSQVMGKYLHTYGIEKEVGITIVTEIIGVNKHLLKHLTHD